MKDFEQPWHIMPSNVIELGLDYSSRETDFDHQIGFLLLDIGVEAALKGFLSYSGDTSIEHIKFPELCEKVEADLQKRGQLGIDFKQISYYHSIRNKQYHQGDGVVATRQSLDGYGKLARNVLNILAGIEIGELTQFQITKKQEKEQEELEKLTERIRKNIKSMESNASILAEYFYPQLASPIMVGKIAEIKVRHNFWDNEHIDFIAFRQQRFDDFLGLIGDQPFDEDLGYESVDLFVQYPRVFPVWIAFWKLSGDFTEDWKSFLAMWAVIEPETTMSSFVPRATIDEGMLHWSYERAGMIYKWVHDNFSDLYTDKPELESLADWLRRL